MTTTQQKVLRTDKMISRKEKNVGWMIFNNPARHNALSLDMWVAMGEIMADFQADKQIRVVVMAGAGEKAFVSGADISEFEKHRSTANAEEEYNRISSKSQSILENFDKPLIAMIQGFCIGGGLAVALTADIRIANEDSQFAIPAARLGLGYGFHGLKILTDLVGPSSAKDILFSARRIDATEAARIGLVNQVIASDAIEDAVRAYVETLCANAPLTIQAAKASVNEALKDPSARDLETLNNNVRAIFDSDDYKEGRQAFMEKREPRFRGH